MSIRYYCDVCRAELERDFVAQRLKGTVYRTGPKHNTTNVNIEVIVGVGKEGAWNCGNICINCLTDAVDFVAKTGGVA